MIYINSQEVDRGDVAVLFAAMVQVAEHHGETLDSSLVSIGYTEGLDRCELAACLVAKLHTPEGDNWDGVNWFEAMEGHDANSLAYRLFTIEENRQEGDDVREWSDAIKTAVCDWFDHNGRAPMFSINGADGGDTLFCVKCQSWEEADAAIPENLQDKYEYGECYLGLKESLESYAVYELPRQLAEAQAHMRKGV